MQSQVENEKNEVEKINQIIKKNKLKMLEYEQMLIDKDKKIMELEKKATNLVNKESDRLNDLFKFKLLIISKIVFFSS